MTPTYSTKQFDYYPADGVFVGDMSDCPLSPVGQMWLKSDRTGAEMLFSLEAVCHDDTEDHEVLFYILKPTFVKHNRALDRLVIRLYND